MTNIESFVPSIDLCRAAMRSEELGDLHQDELASAVERYIRFLRLCALHPKRPLAPTRDIDAMWHLHMLNPRAYQHDCMVLFGELLDHDGGFGAGDEAPILERLFEETAALWELHFGESYVGDAVKCTRNCVTRCTRKCSTGRA